MSPPFRIPVLALLLAMTPSVASAPAESLATRPASMDLDEAAFREGLRQLGLTEWLDQYLADTPPRDDADARLRQREALLKQVTTRPAFDERRPALVEQARSILARLIEDHPDHPGRLRWRFELARDTLERVDPGVFEALLLYDLPGRDRERAHALAGEAARILDTLRNEITDRWHSFESMGEGELEQLVAAGGLRWLEALDGQAALLLSWARFYRELSADLPAEQRKPALVAILAEVTDGDRWTSPEAPPEQRCRVLALATVAARVAGEFPRADRYAREIVAGLKQIEDPAARKRLETVTLLAVLEQIRVMRDRGEFDAALAAIEQARAWAERTRDKDLRAAAAMALVHRGVLAARGGQLSGSVLLPAETLVPIEQLAGRSPAHRDALYGVLAGTLASEPMGGQRPGLALQLLLGAAAADVIAHGSAPAEGKPRLDAAITATQETLGAAAAPMAAPPRGELLFLLGRAYYATGRPLEAARALSDLVEGVPKHDRCDQAAEQAVTIAQQLLHAGDERDAQQAREAFARAVRLLRARSPGSPMARRAQYLLAVALETGGRLPEAAVEYAAVADDDPHVLKARLGRARCLRNVLDQGIADKTLSEPDAKALAERALQAARDAADFARTHEALAKQEANRQAAAEIVLLLARLLNYALIDRPEDALTALDGYETRFVDQPALVVAGLRERMLALRRLKRLDEARAVVERYLQVDADNAGPVMAELLEAMRDQTNAAADRGDTEQAQRIAAEAVQLAQTLLAWSQQRPGRVGAVEVLTIRVWQAWSSLQAGQADDALPLYEQCTRDGEGLLPPDAALRVEIRLGRAECLLALGKADQALPIFTELWRVSPERSPYWWRALVGSLESHRRLKHDPQQIIQSIRQQRYLSPDLGGPRWKRALEVIERECSTPAGQ